MKDFHIVYLLRCSDDTTYTGCTSNLANRLKAHKNGEVDYTKTRLPFELVTYISFSKKLMSCCNSVPKGNTI
ncbi:MAG: GIY-YIG nuclease family protein [Vicingaceae bacterium]